jgi:hypothetical protein
MDIMADLRAVPAAYGASLSGNPADVNYATEFAAAIIRNAQILGAEAALTASKLDELERDDLIGIYVSPGGVTLRDVSLRFYGTPDNWVRIKEFNGLSSSVLERGVVVRVPKA